MSCCDQGGQYTGTTGRTIRVAQVSVTPDDAVAYAVDEVIGGGELNIECALPSTLKTAELVEAVVYETASSGTPKMLPMRLVVLRSSQSPADHSAYASPAPVTEVLGTIEIEAGDWVQLDGSTAIARVNPYMTVHAEGTTLWLVPVAQGAGTYAAAADITMELRLHFD